MTTLTATTNYTMTPPYVDVTVASAPIKPTSAYSSNFAAGTDSWSGFGTGVVLTNDTTTAPASLKLTTTDSPFPKDVHGARALSGLTVGATYKLTAWVRTGPGRVRLAVRESTEGTEIAFGSTWTSTKRTQLTLTFTATIAAQVIEIFAYSPVATTQTPVVWADTILVDPVTWLGTSITRTDCNGTDVPVRLSPGLDTVGASGFTIYDYESALTGTVTYKVTDGLGGTATATAGPYVAPTVTHQQVVTSTATATAVSCAMTVPPVAGDVYVLWVSTSAAASNVTSVTGLGATWTRVGTPNQFSGYSTEWWIGTGATATGNVTTNHSVAQNGVHRANHFRGLTSAAATLQIANQTTSAASLTGTPVTAAAGQLVLQSAYTGNTSALGTWTHTPGTGWNDQITSTNALWGSRNTSFRVPTETTATTHNGTLAPPASNTIAIENLVIGGAAPPPVTATIVPSLTLPATGLVTSNVDAPDYAPVTMLTDYAETSETNGTVHVVLGRSTKLSNPGPLLARSGVLEFWCLDYDDADAIRTLLTSPQVALLRQADYVGLDLYFAARSVAIAPLEPSASVRHWQTVVAYDEVPRP